LKVSKAGGKFLASPLPSNNIYIWKTSAGGEKKLTLNSVWAFWVLFCMHCSKKGGRSAQPWRSRVNSPVHEAGHFILKGTVSQDEYSFTALKAHLITFCL